MIKERRSKRISATLRNLTAVTSVFLMALVFSPQQAEARTATLVEPEVKLSVLEETDTEIDKLDNDIRITQEKVDESHNHVTKLKEELASITDEKGALEKEIEIMRAEIDELKAKKAAKEAREALARQTAQQVVNQPLNTHVPSYAQNSAGNTYSYGYCTWYVANRRYVPNGLGNANTWYARAPAYGMSRGTAPQVGAIATTTAGALGHVAYVEAVHGDGTITISEMNYGAWNTTNSRRVSASMFVYIY